MCGKQEETVAEIQRKDDVLFENGASRDEQNYMESKSILEMESKETKMEWILEHEEAAAKLVTFLTNN